MEEYEFPKPTIKTVHEVLVYLEQVLALPLCAAGGKLTGAEVQLSAEMGSCTLAEEEV